jgi:hypothetical protein
VQREIDPVFARADQYRWVIADRVPFAESIEVKIENRYAVVGARWTSVSFWYQQPPLTADANCDGRVDFDDIDAFVVALTGEVNYLAEYPDCDWLLSDCNGDGTVNFDDIDAFVGALAG